MSLFFVDSNCDLPRDLLTKMPVECINFPCTLNGEVIKFDKIYDGLGFKPNMLTMEVSSPSTSDYVEVFKQCFYRGDDVIYVYASKNLISVDNLMEAKELLYKDFPNRRLLLIDSSNFSIGQGIISYMLAMMYRNGATLDEISDYYDKIKDEFQVFLSLNSLNVLSDAGLVSNASISGGALRVRPIVTVDSSGKFQVVDKVFGKKKSMLQLFEIIKKMGANVVDYPIGIVYNDDDSLALELKENLIKHFGDEVFVVMGRFSPNNLSIIGGGLGICFHVKKRN